MLTDPWKGGRHAGRARHGERAIVGSKKRVHVNLSGDPMFTKVFRRPLSDGEQQNFVSKSATFKRVKKVVFGDILEIFSEFFILILV